MALPPPYPPMIHKLHVLLSFVAIGLSGLALLRCMSGRSIAVAALPQGGQLASGITSADLAALAATIHELEGRVVALETVGASQDRQVAANDALADVPSLVKVDLPESEFARLGKQVADEMHAQQIVGDAKTGGRMFISQGFAPDTAEADLTRALTAIRQRIAALRLQYGDQLLILPGEEQAFAAVRHELLVFGLTELQRVTTKKNAVNIYDQWVGYGALLPQSNESEEILGRD